MEEKKERSFIYNLDILSGKPGLFISGYKNYNTLGGLIITFLCYLSVLFILFMLFTYFFLREKFQL